MWRIRQVKTGSGNTAVQVVSAGGHDIKVIKHLGSGQNQPDVDKLILLGKAFIAENQPDRPLFDDFLSSAVDNDSTPLHLVAVEHLDISDYYHTLTFETFKSWYERCGFSDLNHELIRDLVIARLVEPTSKLQSLHLLKRYFGISHPKNRLYHAVIQAASLKDRVEEMAYTYAKTHFPNAAALIFYDVTTLYFESFDDDELRVCGFSKDNKFNQPQVVIGLVVNQFGFPLSWDVFAGNVFEGHTFIPVINRIKKRLNLETFTVVADAAMLSESNMQALAEAGLHYIVGARLKRLSIDKLTSISDQLKVHQGELYVLPELLGTLICDYSTKRAAKDKSDMEKALKKAHAQVTHPASVTRRSKYVGLVGKQKYILKENLIMKDKLLIGIKGYYTNLNLSQVNPREVVVQYHNLWQVEKSFRMAKSDLLARPIFHYQQESIRGHLVIVFMALCLAKSMELTTHTSLKKIKEILWDCLDCQLIDQNTGATYTKRIKIPTDPLFKLIHP